MHMLCACSWYAFSGSRLQAELRKAQEDLATESKALEMFEAEKEHGNQSCVVLFKRDDVRQSLGIQHM